MVCVSSQYFASYVYRGEEEDVFGVSLSGLVDCLSVMATCDAEAQLVLRWPDANASLAFEYAPPCPCLVDVR